MTTTQKTSEIKIANYDLDKPQEIINFANVLKKVVVEQNLFSNIKGKNYVNVEGWQFAGMSLGVVPVVVKADAIGTDTEIKYRAEVELRRLKDGSVIGYGVGICSNKEKADRHDEYAIVAMAQTRAISRAYRNGFGWLMKAAGYETTPAEEAGGIHEEKYDAVQQAEKELEELNAPAN